jgi:hypothetical protein
MNQIYLDTVRLLTQIAPIVFADGVFALKGGTAIGSGTESHEYILYPQSIPWTFWVSLCSRKPLILW